MVIELRESARLPQEALGQAGVLREPGEEDLEGDPLVQAYVAGLEDGPHPPDAHAPDDLVAPDARTRHGPAERLAEAPRVLARDVAALDEDLVDRLLEAEGLQTVGLGEDQVVPLARDEPLRQGRPREVGVRRLQRTRLSVPVQGIELLHARALRLDLFPLGREPLEVRRRAGCDLRVSLERLGELGAIPVRRVQGSLRPFAELLSRVALLDRLRLREERPRVPEELLARLHARVDLLHIRLRVDLGLLAVA